MNYFLRVAWLAGLCTLLPIAVQAAELRRVAEDVYAILGDLGNRSPENLGNNSNHGVIVTRAGVVLIDPGATLAGARRLETMIREVTDQPVSWVINTGGQDHRWLGNDYFKQKGARVIASAAAVADQRARVTDQLFVLANLVGEAAVQATRPAYADEVFETSRTLEVGGQTLEIVHAGPAHTPGDSFVVLPRQGVVFSGDIVYLDRLAGIMAFSSSRSWLAAFEAMAAREPAVIVPGHGQPGGLAQARAHTYDYLRHLRDSVARFMAAGGDIIDVGQIDQSGFGHLVNFEQLAGRNAQRVYAEMEWE